MNENEVVDNGMLDQTKFSEEALMLPSTRVKTVTPVPARRLSPLTLLLIVVPIMFVLTVGALLFSQRGGERQAVLPSPSPSPEAAASTEIERRFAQLAGEIQTADPTNFTLSFPPIDFSLDLPDASALKIRR